MTPKLHLLGIIRLAVKAVYTIAPTSRCPTVISKPFVPPLAFGRRLCPSQNYPPDTVRDRVPQSSLEHQTLKVVFQGRSTITGVTASKAPHLSYIKTTVQCQAIVKVHGVFPSSRGYTASSRRFQFHRSLGCTAWPSLAPFVQVGTHSSGQGISLPF